MNLLVTAGGTVVPIDRVRFISNGFTGRTGAAIARAAFDRGPELIDQSAAKVKSEFPELWLRRVQAPKLIDLVRRAWNFNGILVKFKLEVDVSEDHLLKVAERSRCQSLAELMVANTLDG